MSRTLSPSEFTAACAQLHAMRPLTQAQQTRKALDACNLTPELRLARRALADAYRHARERATRLQRTLTDLLTERGAAHWSNDSWHRKAGRPINKQWSWFSPSGGNDTQLQTTRDALRSSSATLKSTAVTIQLFDALHSVTGVDYADLPQLDEAAIEQAAYAAAPAKHAAAIERIKATEHVHHY